jgi:hypothetical protein
MTQTKPLILMSLLGLVGCAAPSHDGAAQSANEPVPHDDPPWDAVMRHDTSLYDNDSLAPVGCIAAGTPVLALDYPHLAQVDGHAWPVMPIELKSDLVCGAFQAAQGARFLAKGTEVDTQMKAPSPEIFRLENVQMEPLPGSDVACTSNNVFVSFHGAMFAFLYAGSVDSNLDANTPDLARHVACRFTADLTLMVPSYIQAVAGDADGSASGGPASVHLSGDLNGNPFPDLSITNDQGDSNLALPKFDPIAYAETPESQCAAPNVTRRLTFVIDTRASRPSTDTESSAQLDSNDLYLTVAPCPDAAN